MRMMLGVHHRQRTKPMLGGRSLRARSAAHEHTLGLSLHGAWVSERAQNRPRSLSAGANARFIR
jgi:hypothetical protein